MDYYAILGLDPGASLDSIKIAYRRLARENHPDLLSGSSPDVLAAASKRMAEINQAYAALSRVSTREPGGGRSNGTVSSDSGLRPSWAKSARQRHSPDSSAFLSSVFGELCQQLRAKLAASANMRWRDARWEGFELSVVATSWHSQYGVGLRGFAMADVSSASKLTNYAEVAINHTRRFFKQGCFLFILPFKRISRPEQVAASCRQFCFSQRTAEVVIALVDVAHAKSLLCGPAVRNKQFLQCLENLGLTQESSA